ncbi:MAG TPA: RpiB/LacA/LacB family sugar-phosphate isomerase [Thermodesulfovibrionia bacterium]|nr:RpiB/LacA/LacB family sugar-phosphate isomerase [Thermodesulfovibrionia bacterium]
MSAINLKEAVKTHLQGKGIKVEEVGVSDPANDTPYGDNEADRAMLFCGTGMGMTIVTNKHPHVYAGVCETEFTHGCDKPVREWLHNAITYIRK